MGGAAALRHHPPGQKENSLSQSYHPTGKHLVALCAAVAYGLLVSGSAAAQTGSIVRVDPPNFEVGQGQVEQVDIVIDNAQDVYGIDLRARFDPSIFEIADADPAADGVQLIPGSFIKPDFLVRNTADNQKGTLQYVITQVNPTQPVNGNGVVVTLLVRGKSLGKRGQLTIDFVDIADRRGRKLTVQPKSGTISVVSPKPNTPTPTSNATPKLALALTPEPLPTLESDSVVAPNPVSAPGGLSGNTIFDALLVLIALGGCLGGILVIGAAAFVILRRPAHATRPNAPRFQYQTNRPSRF